MKTIRLFSLIGTGLLCLAGVTPVEGRAYGESRVNASQQAERALGGYRVRPLSTGYHRGQRGERRATYSPAARFSGVTIDPYEVGPMIDGVEIDVPKMTAAVKRRLSAKGYNAGPANGQWTNALEKALQGYQSEVSGASSGIIDSYTLENLGLSVAQFTK